MSNDPGILFSAFEPSGDELAAPLIKELRHRLPHRAIYALGGPRMHQAGAQLIDCTTDNAVMGLGVATQVLRHRRIVNSLRRWMQSNQLAAVVPTDSPAANWSICQLTRRYQPQARIFHLAAPQLWAWGAWRINKLRRLTDHVLCLLPFEPEWFEFRGVPASFVGHPLLNHASQIARNISDLPHGEGPKLALLPGSRDSEVRSNWPTILQAFIALKKEFPDLLAVAAASDERRSDLMKRLCPGQKLPDGVSMLTRDADTALHWSDLAVVVSGTATLQSAVLGKPMVVIYNVKWLLWHILGKWLVRIRTFSLPNLIAQYHDLGHIVPELVPNLHGCEPLINAIRSLIVESDLRSQQQDHFKRILEQFKCTQYAESAAAIILNVIDPPALKQ